MSAVLLLAAALASYAGFACLALAMPEHRERAGGPGSANGAEPTQESGAAGLRIGGGALLALAFALCLLRDGASFGTLLWVVLLTAGALAVAFTLTWRPRWLRAFVPRRG